MDEIQQDASKERQSYDKLWNNVRGFVLYGPAYIGLACPFIYATVGAVSRLDEGALASVAGAAIGGLVGLVLGSVVAVGGTILGGLADADSGIDD